MAQILYFDLTKDVRSSAVFGATYTSPAHINSFVVGDQVPLVITFLNGNSVADESGNGLLTVNIGGIGDIYAAQSTFGVSGSAWTGSIDLSTVEAYEAVSGRDYIDAFLEVEYTYPITLQRRTVGQIPIYLFNSITSGSYSVLLTPEYLTVSESDARYVRNTQAPSASYWALSGTQLYTTDGEQTWSLGVNTTDPQHTLDVVGDMRVSTDVIVGGTLSGSIIGNLVGSASVSISSSNSITSSFSHRSSVATSAGFATLASASYFANDADQAEWASTSSYNVSSSYAVSASWARSAFGSLTAGSSSYALSASYSDRSLSSSFAVNALSASYSSFIYYNVTESLSNISSASWASSSVSASYAPTNLGTRKKVMGDKSVTLYTSSYATVLTINMSATSSCNVKIMLTGINIGAGTGFGVGEFALIKDGAITYSQPGAILSQTNYNYGSYKYEPKIVDPVASAGASDFLIQYRMSGGNTGSTVTAVYEVDGVFNSIN